VSLPPALGPWSEHKVDNVDVYGSMDYWPTVKREEVPVSGPALGGREGLFSPPTVKRVNKGGWEYCPTVKRVNKGG